MSPRCCTKHPSWALFECQDERLQLRRAIFPARYGRGEQQYQDCHTDDRKLCLHFQHSWILSFEQVIMTELSPGLANVPMNGVFGRGLFRRQVELFQNHVIHLRIFFQPFTARNLVGVINHIVEYPAARFVLVWTYKQPGTVAFVFLLIELFLPDIFIEFRAGYAAI